MNGEYMDKDIIKSDDNDNNNDKKISNWTNHEITITLPSIINPQKA